MKGGKNEIRRKVEKGGEKENMEEGKWEGGSGKRGREKGKSEEQKEERMK